MHPESPTTTTPSRGTIDAHTETTVIDHDPALDVVTVCFAGVVIKGPLGHLSRVIDDAAHQLMLVDRARGAAEEALERVRGKANVALLRDTIDRARADARATH